MATAHERWAMAAVNRAPFLTDHVGLRDDDLIARAAAVEKLGRETGKTHYVPDHVANLLRRVRDPQALKARTA